MLRVIPQRTLPKGWLTRNYTTVFKHSNIAELVASVYFVPTLPEQVPLLHGLPEIIITGRANTGKSSLLNAILGRNAFLRTSKRPGRTRSFNFYQVGADPGKLVIADTPGYGSISKPEWGELLDRYLRRRRQLKRVYITLNGKHPLKSYDYEMIKYLTELVALKPKRFTVQPVITKADDICLADMEHHIDRICNAVKTTTKICLPTIVTSATTGFGIDTLRRNIEEACGLATLNKGHTGAAKSG